MCLKITEFPGNLEGNKVKVKNPILPAGQVSTSYGEECVLWPEWPLALAQGERPDGALPFFPPRGRPDSLCEEEQDRHEESCSFS